ncbi:BCL2 associated agonist of cell death b isoform X2 [Paramisgurnus dabryanus]|uniref:BCL2 associated agonist of cell death b isoform X2 n=1 Tax=Paramisgurnus dabryanus TaxID=90735 RepID=UPI0031F4087A
MAHMFTLSDNESDTEDHEDSGRTKVKMGSTQRKQYLNVTGEQVVRQRNHSMNEEALKASGIGEEEVNSFRRRSSSAPPALWAAKKYGRQLRRMSDEFDILLDQGMKRVKSAGAASNMRQSPSWLSFLWSHKESDAESRPAE